MNRSAPAVETILYNGSVITQYTARAAQAVAISGGRILAVGQTDDLLHLAGPQTEKIDLDGRMLVSGFFDAHIHFYEWALKRQDLQLADVTSLDDLLARVRRAAQDLTPDRWIMGQGWNETDWSEPLMPTRRALDRAAPDHPVLLWRCDLHLAAANSAALRLAGITAATPDPPEGRIERDAGGEPTGILRELAINCVRRAVAAPGMQHILQAFEQAAAALHRRGVTAIHDVRLMADPDAAPAFQAFQELDRTGCLPLRCWVSLPGHGLEDAIRLGLRTGFGNDRLRVGHVKFFADGGMGARTAWMIDPYRDAQHGMPLMDMQDLAGQIRRADEAGLSVMVHAVGDQANRELIAIFEQLRSNRARSGSTTPALAHRIEHVQMIRPEDAARLANLDVALCVTPPNMVLDMNLIDSALGDAGRWTYDFRRLIDSGAPVMFSSDCPVCDPAPLVGMQAAITRQRPDGTPAGGWYPQSRVSAAEALTAYTSTPADAHRAAADLGAIAPAKKADLAVLSRNILTIPPAQISEVTVDMTLFEGKIVYRRF